MEPTNTETGNNRERNFVITTCGAIAIVVLTYYCSRDGFSSIELIIIFVVALLATLLGGYLGAWRWTGFSSYITEKTNTEIDQSTGNIKTTITREIQPAKTLWDWMQLLIIPVVIAGVSLGFSQLNTLNQLKIATDNQRELALQAYIDKMSELLINNEQPTEITPGIRSVARTRTLAVLRQVDGKRKGLVLQFLSDSGFINETDEIIDLIDADLQGTILPFANLDETDLSNLDLHGSDLRGAHLRNASLIGTDLQDVDLLTADLSNSNFLLAKLQRANLWAAKLTGAMLDKANFTEADLSKADLTDASLVNVIWSNTTCPDRTNSDNNGGTCLNHLAP